MQIDQYRKAHQYEQTTRMMQQYLDIKFTHRDCLLLFRMGDFYELFFDDAVIASKALNITLTKRGKSDSKEAVADQNMELSVEFESRKMSVPMCGIPYHALETYLNKLIAQNYRIAICDQLETPEEAKKRDGYKALVKRDVTRIITPGTILEESLLTCNVPNYLASLAIIKDKASICYVDISTREIFVTEIHYTKNYTEIVNEIARISPNELILSEKFKSSEIVNNINNLPNQKIYYQVDSCFAYTKCLKIILDFYNINNIKAVGEISDSQISAIGSILEYLLLTQKRNMPALPLPRIINRNNFMIIDSSTRRSLEITSSLHGSNHGSLLSIIDHTITKSGSRLLYQLLSNPLTNIDEINNRLNITDFFYNNQPLVENIKNLLKKTSDLERLITRISMNRSDAPDLLSIKSTLENATNIKAEFLTHCGFRLPPYIDQLTGPLSIDNELLVLLNDAIKEDAPLGLADGGFIKHSYHPKIAELYNLINNGKAYIEKLKNSYRCETKIDNLKISHNNVLGLFIEVTLKNSEKIIDSKFIHRQTTSNSARYSTLELQKLESDMVNAKSLVIGLEQELYKDVCRQIIDQSTSLIYTANALSFLDVFCNFAYIARNFGYTKPELTQNQNFEILQGRHPVVQSSLSSSGKSFVSNDCNLSKNNMALIWLLTGPNMSGKSTFLRQNALIALLAQIGSFVPAEKAKIGIIDKIFSRIGSSDDLSRGQSTFMMEMLETSAIIAQATPSSLIILDEIGRGTSTYDGVSIAWSVLEYIHNKIKARCLFATHYHELTQLSDSLENLQNYTIAIEETKDQILFLHHIVEGSADKSYGIHVASLAGLPELVIKRANEILNKLEKNKKEKNKKTTINEPNNSNFRLF